MYDSMYVDMYVWVCVCVCMCEYRYECAVCRYCLCMRIFDIWVRYLTLLKLSDTGRREERESGEEGEGDDEGDDADEDDNDDEDTCEDAYCLKEKEVEGKRACC
jgi:hypothetical protein